MNLIRLYYTLKPLRWQQYWYRAWHPVKRIFFRMKAAPLQALAASASWPEMNMYPLPVFDQYNPAGHSFTLLNIKHSFSGAIDWNISLHGPLWRYHLNYMGWLNDESISVKAGIQTLHAYYTAPVSFLRAGLASYPISLRGMNVIRFLLHNNIQDQFFAGCIYKHYSLLNHFPEYHLQANHLWQNGGSLICAGYYFRDKCFYDKGKEILAKALEEQVLADGGHVERTPMYHSLLLCSLLQCIELTIKLTITEDPDFRQKMRDKAALMLGWLDNITFSNGKWPQVNDSTEGMAPTPDELRGFAKSLNIFAVRKPLKESNYRMYRKRRYELFINTGSIAPVWQPGHAHSDEFSFCLNIDGREIIVDPGIHTYNEGSLRNWERSTDAHNTVSVNKKNASDVWKSFRVGKKADVRIQEEVNNQLQLIHNGFNLNYTREFSLLEDLITLDDYIPTTNHTISLNLHFAPDIVLKKYGFYGILAGNLQIDFKGASSVEIETYNYCREFNKQAPAQRLHIKATSRIITRLQILDAN